MYKGRYTQPLTGGRWPSACICAFITIDVWGGTVTIYNDKQQKMLEFETNWYALGGGSSHEISEQFGLSDRDFFSEIGRLLDTSPPAGMTTSELRRMREVIRRRLWMAR